VRVGDLVKHFLTEQIGIVVDVSCNRDSRNIAPVQVMWTTQGESLFGPGSMEWCGEQSLEALDEAR
jgi:hypothetical protein